MKLSPEDALELRGYLRAKGLTIDAVATLVERHRTTMNKKLSGAAEITPFDLLELGEQIALHEAQKGNGKNRVA